MYIFNVRKATFQLLELTIGGIAETWSSAGFEMIELPNGSSGCQLGSVQIQFDATERCCLRFAWDDRLTRI